MADQFSALQKLFPSQPVRAATVSAAPAGAVNYAGAFDQLVKQGKTATQKKQQEQDSGGVLSGLGSALTGVLSVVDLPRSVLVSAFKELADTGAGQYGLLGAGGLLLGKPPEGSKASWDDFTRQIGEHIGFGQVIEEYRPNAPHWAKVAGGFTGDVLLDPLTYVAPGVENLASAAGRRTAESAAQHAAYAGLDAAIKSGASKSMADALIKSGREAGFAMREGGGFADEALNALIVETQKRGAGALTQRALVKAGITEEVATRLGLGRLGRTYFHGAVSMPFTTPLTDFVEGIKGGVKARVRQTSAANFLRGKFGEQTAGALRQIVFDKGGRLGPKAEALIAISVMEQPKRTARMWARLTENGILQDFSGVVRDAEGNVDKVATKAAEAAGVPSWHNVSDQVAATATHGIETGATGPLEDVGRKWFRSIHQNLVDAGVPVGNLGENYVPHIPTQDARILAGKDTVVRDVLSTLRDENGFQKFRELTAGKQFLGETLQEGSIKEINDIMLRNYGIKMFEDDVRVIMPKYLRASEQALKRANTFSALEQVGLSGPLLERVERQLNPDRSWIREAADLQARRDLLVAEQQVQLRNGATIRRDGLFRARVEYARQATELRGRLRAVDRELATLERAAARAETRVSAVTAKLDAAKATVKQLQKQVKTLKGDARLQAVKELKVAEQTVREQTRELRQLKAAVKEVSARNVPVRQTTERLAPLRQQILAKQAEKSALEEQISGLRETIGQITAEERNTLLATERDANRSLATAKARAKQLVRDVGNVNDAATSAVNAHLLAQADSAVVKDSLNQSLTQVNSMVDSLTGLPKLSPTQKIRLGLQNDLRERFNTLLQVINDPNASDELRAIAGLEAAAAQSDLAAADLGDQIATLGDMIRLTKDRREIDKIMRATTHGSVQVAENLQLPQWLFDATTVGHAVKDITKAGAVFEKYMNLFRAYTTWRTGFHVRNAYTALFNMYLEGGVENFAGMKKWHEFYGMVQKNPDNYMVAAEQKFGAETAGRLNDALEVMYGSGAGQIGSRTAATMYGRGSLNPFDENNRMIQLSRKLGSKVEDNVRGAHAFAVLERGGSKELAADTVAKWHFNYSDLGSWDQKAKNIVPFWTFFSRNLSLQAQTYVRSASRYNRALKNFERNWNSDSTDPTVVPAYFQKAGAIRISGGDKPLYWFPDLPMTLFPQQMSQLTTPSQLPELLSNVTPLIKVPIEAFAGKSMYTGIPTKDKYVPVPVGFNQLLRVSGIEIPGGIVENTKQGPVMKASYAQALMGLLPGFGQVERLIPISEGQYGGWTGLITGATGFGVRRLDQKAIAGENIRRAAEAKLKAKYARSLASYNK